MRVKHFDVFAGRFFEGNPTAIVYYDAPVDEDRMQSIAVELSVPDTLFMLPPAAPGLLFSSLAFSPYEELKVCGQGIVGAVFALIDDGEVSEGAYEIETRLGRLRVFVEGAAPHTVFTSLGTPTVSEATAEQSSRISRLLGGSLPSFVDQRFVDLGRKRLIVRVTMDVLRDISPEPAKVMGLCADLGTTGVVFFAREDAGGRSFRSRHFTTSLNGAEDAVTGGSAGAILAYAGALRLAPGREPIVTHQGDFATRGGYIQARFDEHSGEVFIGGNAIKYMDGRMYF